jgi:hypothetical protein
VLGVLIAETIHPECMCEGGGRGGKRGERAFYYTYVYSKKGQSCEGAKLICVLVAETIHPACMCEGGGRGGERGGRAFCYTRERVLFIGTQFSILYTSMYSPAETATPRA